MVIRQRNPGPSALVDIVCHSNGHPKPILLHCHSAYAKSSPTWNDHTRYRLTPIIKCSIIQDGSDTGSSRKSLTGATWHALIQTKLPTHPVSTIVSIFHTLVTPDRQPTRIYSRQIGQTSGVIRGQFKTLTSNITEPVKYRMARKTCITVRVGTPHNTLLQI